MMRKILCAVLAGVILTIPAMAASAPSDQAAAAAYVQEKGIMTGDQNGSLNLSSGLSRAELAVILTRLHREGEVNPDHYTWACYFTDVPAWAKPYVGYCTAMLLVSGYDSAHYGPNDPVTPNMACTVILRCCGYDRGEGKDWSYHTASDYAAGLGLIDPSTAQAAAITRGEVAVLIYRIQQDEAPAVPVEPIPQVDGVTIAPDGTITSKVITKASWSREDFSQQANPAIFTGYYSKSWYNALRQSILDGETIVVGNNEDDCNLQYLYAHTLVPYDSEEQFDAFSDLLLRLSGLYNYQLGAEPYTKNQYEFPGYTIIKVCQPDMLKAPAAYIQPVLADLTGKSDAEKVIALNNYLCDLLDYGTGKSAGVADIFSDHSAPALGQCGSYAHAFKFLCAAADIPCITVLSDNHAWNEVYVDGQWLTVDVTFNDASVRRDSYLLTKNAPRQDICPAGTRFAKELLVPGSTK